MVPKLILQPLLENAVYHGIEPAAAGGVISLRGEYVDDMIRICLTNSLPSARDAEPRRGNQLAQNNVRQRLSAFFGPHASLHIVADQDQYQVILEFPHQTRISP